MAFDMTIAASRRKDRINWNEQYLFRVVELQDLPCPSLEMIWEQFYEDPRIPPDQATAVIQELDLLDKFLRANPDPEINLPAWIATHARLREFFREAVQRNSMIITCSD